MESFIFKNLVVWQKAMELTKLVYGIVRALPSEERYALADQLRRAVVSIPSNIAEGNGRAGNGDYAHFLAIARGSLFETITQLELSKQLGYISDDEKIDVGNNSIVELSHVYQLAEEVGRMLTSMLQKFDSIQQRNNHHCTPIFYPYFLKKDTP